MSLDVVLFEDGDDTTELTQLLDELGTKWEVYSDPREYLKAVSKHRPKACLIDVNSVRKDMLMVMIQSIVKVIGTTLPIVAIAQKSNKAMIDQARNAGAKTVLEKPVSIISLAQSLKTSIKTPQIESYCNSASVAKAPSGNLPASVEWYFNELAPILAGLSDSIEDSYDVEFQTKFYLDRALPFREELVNMVNSMRKSETKADLQQCVRLFGISNMRMLLLAIRVSDLTKSGVFTWNAQSGRPNVDPKKIIPYTARLLDHLGEDSRYRTTAVCGGLIFDVMSILIEKLGNRKAMIKKQIETAVTDAIKKADKTLKAAKNLKELALDQQIISTVLLREAGKTIMAAAHDDYLDQLAALEKKSIKPRIQHYVEKQKYGTSHNIVGALACHGFSHVNASARAVLFVDQSYLLTGAKEDKDHYALATACSGL